VNYLAMSILFLTTHKFRTDIMQLASKNLLYIQC